MKQKFLLIIFFFCCYNCFAQLDTATARLNNYRNGIVAVFNKCNLQDDEITQAIKAKKVIDIESGRKSLLQCAVAGMKELNAMQDFDGDPALKFSSREALKFYTQLAESDLPQIRDYFIVEANFQNIKREFKKKPAKKYSQQEIQAYNVEAKKYNEALTRYIQLGHFISASRKSTLYNWNASQKIFMDAHKPRL